MASGRVDPKEVLAVMRSIPLKVCLMSLLLAAAARGMADDSSSTKEQKERAVGGSCCTFPRDINGNDKWVRKLRRQGSTGQTHFSALGVELMW